MPDFNAFFCVVNDGSADPNRRFFSSAVMAYQEADKREAAGIPCEVVHRDEWDHETMRAAVSCETERLTPSSQLEVV